VKPFRRSGPIERKLRRDRPQPSETLVRRISADVSHRPVWRGWNLGLAFALTAALAVAFSLTGGIGYASSAVSSGTSALTDLVSVKGSKKPAGKKSSQASNTQAKGSSNDQYEHKVLICHRPPGNPANAHTISVDEHAVPAHLAHGDTLGPC
jgi:hypothetical protein